MQAFTVFTALFLPLTWATPLFPRDDECDNFTVGQVIETSSGPVAGHAATDFSEVSEYLGIPFAQPPVGDLRFAAPVKYEGSSLINGSAYGASCIQKQSSGTAPTAEQIAASNITDIGLAIIGGIGNRNNVSEDCLTLNIWSKPQSGETKKAVMVYIYGGGFSGGTSSSPIFNGALLADEDDVVVVNFNYRLSILGFPGNPTAQDNVALLDQRLAVEWIRDNIAAFSGDASRITLFGQSAGAASADYYSYAWTSDPIVSGIILQSGTSFSFDLPYTANAPAEYWYAVSEGVGCGNSSTDSATLLACMRTVDVDSIINAIPVTALSALFSPFGPTVDDVLVFANYSLQTPASIPVLVGSNDYEAGLFRTEYALAGMFFADSDWDEYTLAGWTCPAATRANASLSANNPTWRYRYFANFPNINISSEGGAYHGSELPLLFGTTDSYAPNSSTVEEVAFENYIRGAWLAFAKDPANGLKTYDGGWPTYDPAEESLVQLGYDNLVGTNLAQATLYDGNCATASLQALICRVLGVC